MTDIRRLTFARAANGDALEAWEDTGKTATAAELVPAYNRLVDDRAALLEALEAIYSDRRLGTQYAHHPAFIRAREVIAKVRTEENGRG